MEKLTINHLAPYLPYGLKMYDRGRIFELRSLSAFGMNITDMHKPILRPLSSIDTNTLINDLPGNQFKVFYNWIDCFNTSESESERRTFVNVAPYLIVEWCFKNHFDVFGLIEKGLAVDTNTIEP